MKTWLGPFALILCCLFLPATGGGQALNANPNPEVRIGFIPSGDHETLKKGAYLLAKELQDQTNIPITVYIPKSYASLLTAIRDHKVDFALMTAASYVSLEKEGQMQVLLKQVWAEPFYYSVLLSRKDSSLRKLEDLKGKSITFVDERSSSGYLYPKVMLQKKGWDNHFFKEVKFSGSHSRSVEMLVNRETDAIAVFADDKNGERSAWQKFSQSLKNAPKVQTLWHSEPIPNNPFCVRQDFYDKYPKIVHTLMFALIDATEKLKDRREVVDVVGAHGFMPATSRQYDPVREMVKELGKENSSGL